ncbi:hypothetical protein M501DRAFT_752776 [Patellaria atrata CBS 101060]|uniref:UBX domain-containing protein n=1 Tax=Patellaria atrata CBS 101060 TaxID=1346257 RepID=A0A9P4SBZ6_9PEZI|nr:hypothetical protein M501DRAFT_752776 [Patellaria atrata CBS 101060]
MPSDSAIFHEGGLQSGISLAIQTSKLVVCFIYDDSEESKIWETEWLVAKRVRKALVTKTVALRIAFGSPEAGFLAAFCPVSEAPMMIVIHNGRVLEILKKDMSREEWFEGLGRGLGVRGLEHHEEKKEDSEDRQPNYQLSSSKKLSGDKADSETATNQASQDPPVEQPVPREPKGKERATSQKDDTRRKPGNVGSTSTIKNFETIPSQSEKDKSTGKPSSRKATIGTKATIQPKPSPSIQSPKPSSSPSASRSVSKSKPSTDSIFYSTTTPTPTPRAKPTDSALQIRLFDGTTHRNRFPLTSTLSTSVRPWVDSLLSSFTCTSISPPYTFLHILTPLPNHTISVFEEAQSLQELGLVPSATLVLVPVRNYVEGYQSQGGGLLGSVWGMATGAFYNGNHLSFEPNRSDNNDDDDR